MARRKTLTSKGEGGRPRKGEHPATVTARERTKQLDRLADLSASGRAVRTGHAIGRALGRAGVWRRPRASSELRKTLAAREAERARQEKIDATILAGQGGRCAACGEAPHHLHRDGDREKVLCRPCYFLIEEARERHETPELAAKWLTAAARYLTTTQGGAE